MNAAIYPGTFDPITFGHLNIIERGLNVFDKIIVACNTGDQSGMVRELVKTPHFEINDRIEMLQSVFSGESPIEVDCFSGLLVNYLKKKNITTILRGIRTVQDFEYEFQMALANKAMHSGTETVFMLTDERYAHISSSLIKEIAAYGGDVTTMVPSAVLPWMEKLLTSRQEPSDGSHSE